MVWVTKIDKKDNFCSKICVPEQQLAAAFENTHLEHLCRLEICSQASITRLTNIACTIGIACRDVKIIEEMIENGMNIAVLNFCNSKHFQHLADLQKIRTAVKNYSDKIRMTVPLAIAMMTRGPLLRTQFPIGGNTIEMTIYEGDTIYLTGDEDYILKENPPYTIHVNYKNLHNVLKKGNKVNIRNRRVVLVCTDVKDLIVICKVEQGGNVRHHDCINLPGVPVNIPPLPDKDKSDIRFAVENDFDMIFVGHIRSKAAIDEIREILGPEGQHIKIISQIENQQAMEILDEIIEVSDGLMVSRIDLSNEMDEEEIFIAQKSIIGRCNAARKPVVISSYLYEYNPKSCRTFAPESSDIANSVIDGVDCIFLRRETSLGDFPTQMVLKVANICKQAEAAIWQKQLVRELSRKILPPTLSVYALAASAVEISMSIMSPAIIVISSSLKSAQLMIQFRPKCPVVAITRNEKKARQAHLFRGILPLLYTDEMVPDWDEEVQNRFYHGIKFGRTNGFIMPGDTVVVMTCSRQGVGYTDKMTIHYVPYTRGGPCIC